MPNTDFETWTSEAITQMELGISLPRPGHYESMFKYVSLDSESSWDHLRRTLHRFELNGSSAASLNDPFELSPYVFDDLQPSSIAEAVRHKPVQWALRDQDAPPLSEVFADVQSFRDRARSYLKNVAAQFRIIAFCERVDSGLLWSHYANSYRGACLHFLAGGFHWHHRVTLGRVTYSKHRPAYPLSLALALSPAPSGAPVAVNSTPLRRAQSNKILFFTKAQEWAYEAEIRHCL